MLAIAWLWLRFFPRTVSQIAARCIAKDLFQRPIEFRAARRFCCQSWIRACRVAALWFLSLAKQRKGLALRGHRALVACNPTLPSGAGPFDQLRANGRYRAFERSHHPRPYSGREGSVRETERGRCPRRGVLPRPFNPMEFPCRMNPNRPPRRAKWTRLFHRSNPTVAAMVTSRRGLCGVGVASERAQTITTSAEGAGRR